MGEGKVVARTLPAGTPTWVRDATLNDSDKSFTVPANKRWILKYIAATIECSATVGNRVLEARITNGADIVAIGPRSGVITAGQDASYQYSTGGLASSTATDMASLFDGQGVNVTKITAAIPLDGYALPGGYVVRVLDVGAIDVAADDMVVVLYYEELDV